MSRGASACHSKMHAAKSTTSTASCAGVGEAMEGESSDLDEGEGESQCGPTSVLWEKCIKQSIFVDISDDDSLHLSDLQEGSFTVHLSRLSDGSGSLHLSESGAPSVSYGSREEDSGSSVSDSGSESVVVSGTKHSPLQAPAQQPDAMERHDHWTCEDGDAVDTSDEEQEDLPYDGALNTQDVTRSDDEPFLDHGSRTESTPENPANPGSRRISDLLNSPGLPGRHVNQAHVNLSKEVIASVPAAEGSGAISFDPRPEEVSFSPVRAGRGVSDVTDLLLRHFSLDELLNPSGFIQAETMPEVSLMDSIDEAAMSQIGRSSRCTNAGEDASLAETLRSQSKEEEEEEEEAKSTVVTEVVGLPASQVTGSEESKISRDSEAGSWAGSEDVSVQNEEDCSKDSNSGRSQDLTKPNGHAPKIPFTRARSFGELKYGQGQVHFPLPDFSKVAPKVKIPKGNGAVKTTGLSPAMSRAQSSPGILGKSPSAYRATADVISRVLEDSIRPVERPYIFRDEEDPPGLVRNLQAEYDRLLNKYSDDGDVPVQMRTWPQTQAVSEPSLFSVSGNKEDVQVATGNRNESAPTPESRQSPQTECDEHEKKLGAVTPVQTASQTEGDKLTSELREIISQFMEKVGEFKKSVDTMSLSVEEQQMVLKTMMNAQDELERHYISKKEEHRALEMQNYMGLARNTGAFDPERQVEGDIFRIGMHLEDVKEQIDRNVCHSFSPPPSSSTPTSPLRVALSSTPSLHPSVHEELLLTVSSSPVNEEDGETKGRGPAQGASSVYSNTLISTSLQYSSDSREILGTASEEEDTSTSVLAEEVDFDGILGQFLVPKSPDSEWTSERLQRGVKTVHENPRGLISDLSPTHTTHTLNTAPSTQDHNTQRLVRPETDSGFGSSDLSRPATGHSQSHLHTESPPLPDDSSSLLSMSGSDSEVRTAVTLATGPGGVRRGRQQPGCNTADPWPGDTTQNTPSRLGRHRDTPVCAGEGDAVLSSQLRKRVCDGALHQTQTLNVDNIPAQNPHTHICTCHSEVIQALQREVFRLKREVQESLGHLPHLTQQLDQLTRRYRQERRPRHRHRAEHTHSSSRGLNSDSSLQRVEDWISSDMEPSKSRGTDSEGSGSVQKSLSVTKRGKTHSLHSTHSNHMPRHTQPSPADSMDCFTVDSPPGLSLPAPRGRASAGPSLSSSGSCRALGESDAIYSNRRHLPPSMSPFEKPLLQVNYGSSCSLPASFKIMEKQPSPTSTSRRRSTQSDSALLPSNVYFQRAFLSPHCSFRTKHRGSKEEDINRTLNRAIETAMLMKRTTDRMAKSLSADLAKAHGQRELRGPRPSPEQDGI